MNSILKNALSTDAIMQLRKTRTSEVSTFVKNYNQAQSRALRKEVGIWYKDTNHVLRTMNGQQHKLYASLLQLSKARKTIKTQRQDENKLKKITLDSNKKRKELMERRRKQALLDRERNKTNILTISETIDEQFSDETSDDGDHDDRTEQLDSDGNLALTVRNVSNFEKSLDNEVENERDFVFEATSKINNESEAADYENSSEACTDHNDANAKLSDNVIDMIKAANTQNDLSYKTNEKTTTKTELKGLILTKPMRYSIQSKSPQMFDKRRKRTGRLKSKRFSQLDNIAIPEEAEVMTFSEKENETEISPTDKNEMAQNNLEVFSSAANEHIESPGKNIPKQKKVTRTRKVTNFPRVKQSRSDPSEEINTKSSIQAMEGKQYQVTIYKKDSKGNLLEEDEIVDTTVDVAKYFHFSSYRERLTRKKLLEESRDIEIKQRKKVSEFLVRLSREEEKTRQRIKEIAKQNEEARLALLKRTDTIKKGPPKYGVRNDTTTPGYVRKYVRPLKDENFYTRRERKRSSWYLPSIYSLNASLNASNSMSSSLNSTSNQYKAQQRHIEDICTCASHLVNINVEKYMRDTVAL